MNVGNICRRHAVTVRPFEELTKAAQLMREKHVGYLVVVEPDAADGLLRPIGVLTDRDIVITVVARETGAGHRERIGVHRESAARNAPNGSASPAGTGSTWRTARDLVAR